MRFFVALDIPETVRGAIGDLIARLTPLCPSARWVRAESMHVTLKFIGEVSDQTARKIPPVLAAVRVAGEVELGFGGTGFFPNEQRPRVLWAGISASPNLADLAREIEQKLEPLGIAREKRSFQPHLTLARFSSPRGLQQLQEELRQSGPHEFGATRSSEFHLYQSQLRPSGAVYTRVETFLLAGALR